MSSIKINLKKRGEGTPLFNSYIFYGYYYLLLLITYIF
ncbi:hypothetical protein HMPREF0378_1503 [Eubacterium nodatum ATCC 33099]|nr:hypothetical protein HMPREF0378_1503 [Eubacterium nodatum ATCC 33099]